MLIFKFLEKDSIPRVIELVTTVFDKDVAHQYNQEGNNEFHKYLDYISFVKRINTNHELVGAYIKNKLVGVLEIRDSNHISLLFVSGEFQSQGIGRQLFNFYLNNRPLNHNGVFTVNASPNAVRFYESIGFYKNEKENVKNGIRFFPMRKILT